MLRPKEMPRVGELMSKLQNRCLLCSFRYLGWLATDRRFAALKRTT
jgi:hypothetical protein